MAKKTTAPIGNVKIGKKSGKAKAKKRCGPKEQKPKKYQGQGR